VIVELGVLEVHREKEALLGGFEIIVTRGLELSV